MLISKKLTHPGLLIAIVSLGAVGCDRGGAAEEDSFIDPKPLIDTGTEGPRTNFPPEWQQKDGELNKFINAVLKSCEEGDYDKFCRFLGTLETPPSIESFKRLWAGVREIAVRSVHTSNTDPPQYFVHAIVRLRQPDTQKRTERDIVLRVFREMDQFRISGAPKELVQRILAADSQPASAPETQESPSIPAAATAPDVGA